MDDWSELITLVVAVVALCLSVVSALASWRSATAASDSTAIAKAGEYRDITFLTGVDRKASTHVLFKEHVPALICEEFDTIIADFGMGFHTLPTSVGRVELELTISAVGNEDVYVWNIGAMVFYHGVKNGTHSVDLRGLPPVLVSERQKDSGP